MSRSIEEARAAGVKVRETQHNIKRRKPWHDYHLKGTYMLTLVVKGRRPVLGRLIVPVGEPTGVVAPTSAVSAPTSAVSAPTSAVSAPTSAVSAPTPAVSAPTSAVSAPTSAVSAPTSAVSAAGIHIELTELGRTIRDEEIRKISAIYKTVEVWKLCIMPDHIHMIVRVREDLPKGKHLGTIVGGFKGGCSRAWWRMGEGPCADAQGVTTTTPSAETVGLPSLFESGYNDLILLDDDQLDNWKHYLDDNPRRLAIKRRHPDFFTILNYTDIGEWHCQLVGNSFLLNIPQKVAVIVHSAYTDEEYAYYREKWLACGEAGGILVSASIATREKEVMREAMNRGYRIILVKENGFPPLYKPAGESFDACSEGRLLQVSPWEYHMERRTISREQCLMLNRLVEVIANL